MDLKEIKFRVADSRWRTGPYGNKPITTFNSIVTDSFDNVKRLGNNAGHCKYDEMYRPLLGELRRSASYSSLAPTNGMGWVHRHIVGPDLRPYNSYKTKQGEWRQEKERSARRSYERPHSAMLIPEMPSVPLPPEYRRMFKVPISTTRFENFARYWGGRAHGLEYSQPMLYDHADNYTIEEDRRYNTLPWAPSFLPTQLTARHGRQRMLTPF
uniref:Uncharacterized protein n=1 Tax=Panagrolaimus sp. ES5 TaxID=591445 RepID=A0AC34GR70_9BILA